MRSFDDNEPVLPDGVAIRRLRRGRGWSRRDFVRAIAEASVRASGRRETISVNQLEGIEEGNERVDYDVLCRVAAGLNADPVDLLQQSET